jgi:hypothetical protein
VTDQRLDILLDQYFDGALADADRAEFERALLSSPGARAQFWDRARLHADATQWGQQEWGRRMAAGPEADPAPDVGPPMPAPPRTSPRATLSRRTFWWVATAAAACVGILVFLLSNRDATPAPGSDGGWSAGTPATAPAGVAVLASSVDAAWADAGAARSPGAVLQPGTVLKLTAGAAQVEFYSGARLILQGPAEVEVRSETEAYCRVGRAL